VDDSIYKGDTIRKNLELIQSKDPSVKVTTAAVVVDKETQGAVDLFYKIIPSPRLFEWNLQHYHRGSVAADMDGVLCENCPSGTDLEEQRYRKWIKNAKPYLIPNFEIDAIITCRLERYREDTEDWLRRFGVRYRELVMWDLKSKEERRNYAEFKSEALLKVKPHYYWESSAKQAQKIWEMTKIPTLCTDEMMFYGLEPHIKSA